MVIPILISAMAVFGEGDAKSLSDRLLMHWNTHATDVYVRDQAVVGIGGERAAEPTVVFCGNRSHVTAYKAPKIEDLPRREEARTFPRAARGRREDVGSVRQDGRHNRQPQPLHR